MKIQIEKTKQGYKIISSKYKVIHCKTEKELNHKLQVLDEIEKLDKEYQEAGRILKQTGLD